jgi:hypothetical protein
MRQFNGNAGGINWLVEACASDQNLFRACWVFEKISASPEQKIIRQPWLRSRFYY